MQVNGGVILVDFNSLDACWDEANETSLLVVSVAVLRCCSSIKRRGESTPKVVLVVSEF